LFACNDSGVFITSNSWDPTDDCGIDYPFVVSILLVISGARKTEPGGRTDFVD